MDRLEFVAIIFFVTLGPLKTIGPFAQLTRNFEAKIRHSLAIRSTLIASITGLFIIFIANVMRVQWGIGRPELLITFGILLMISSLEALRAAQSPAARPDPPESPAGLALSPLAFPVIITPYGIAALLLFAAVAQGQTFIVGTFGLFLLVMLLNYLSMVFARPILAVLRPQILQVIGWILGVLQLSAAVFAITVGLTDGLLA
jgi:multiple antibiotic resistance protein